MNKRLEELTFADAFLLYPEAEGFISGTEQYLLEDSHLRAIAYLTFGRSSMSHLNAVCMEIFRIVARGRCMQTSTRMAAELIVQQVIRRLADFQKSFLDASEERKLEVLKELYQEADTTIRKVLNV